MHLFSSLRAIQQLLGTDRDQHVESSRGEGRLKKRYRPYRTQRTCDKYNVAHTKRLDDKYKRTTVVLHLMGVRACVLAQEGWRPRRLVPSRPRAASFVHSVQALLANLSFFLSLYSRCVSGRSCAVWLPCVRVPCARRQVVAVRGCSGKAN